MLILMTRMHDTLWVKFSLFAEEISEGKQEGVRGLVSVLDRVGEEMS